MKKKILTLSMLVVLCLCTAVLLSSCDEDDYSEYEYVDGKWVLTRAETVRVAADYHSAAGEVDIYSSSDVYTHKVDYKYHPVDKDPSDGPTPHEGVFSCTIDIPDTLTPGKTFKVLFEAKAEFDEMPDHTTGICCGFGVLKGTFEGERMVDMIKSAGGYVYTGALDVYPIYAGGNFVYGEDIRSYEPYKSSMSDTLTTEAPRVYKEALEGKEPPKLILKFYSNAGESVFEYSFVQDK